jgi:hypothetical protein
MYQKKTLVWVYFWYIYIKYACRAPLCLVFLVNKDTLILKEIEALNILIDKVKLLTFKNPSFI